MIRGIVMVAMPWTHELDDQAPLGHASLVAALNRQCNLDVRQVIQPISDNDFSLDDLTEQIITTVNGISHKEVDVGVGVYIWNEKHVNGLLCNLRERGFQGRIILGGPQISYAYAGLEQAYPKADVFVRGYAETALCALARSTERLKIRGVHYAGETDSVDQAEVDLKNLPSPWLEDAIQLDQDSTVRWESQRGCNFRCSFCQHRQPDARMPITIVEKSRIRSEIDLFCKKNVRRISVLDPVFNTNNNHSIDVLNQFSKHKFQGEISLQCRVEMIDNAFLDVAQKLNVILEFGIQSIHKREYLAVGRPNNMAKIAQVLREVQHRKIKHEVSLIYGLPEQTLQSFQSSVDWCLTMSIPVIKAFPLLLLRGTELEREQDKWSFIVKQGDLPMVISSKSFTSTDWEEMDRIANTLHSTERSHPANLQTLMRTLDSKSECGSAWLNRALGKGQ